MIEFYLGIAVIAIGLGGALYIAHRQERAASKDQHGAAHSTRHH